MAKKSNASKKKKHIITSISPADKQLDLIGHQIFQGKSSKLKQTITFFKEK